MKKYFFYTILIITITIIYLYSFSKGKSVLGRNNFNLIKTEINKTFEDTIYNSTIHSNNKYYYNRINSTLINTKYSNFGSTEKPTYKKEIIFNDSIIISPEIKNNSNHIFLEFNCSFFKQNTHPITIKLDNKTLAFKIKNLSNGNKITLELGKLSSSSKIIIIKNSKISISNIHFFNKQKNIWTSRRKKSIIIIDIENFDNIKKTPNLAELFDKSRSFSNFFTTSPNKTIAIKSSFSCLFPNKFTYNNSETDIFTTSKKIISDSLRSLTIPLLYAKSGYETMLFSNYKKKEIPNYFNFNFDNLFFSKKNIDIITSLILAIKENKNKQLFLHSIISNDTHNKYNLETIDFLIDKLISFLKSNKILDQFIIVVYSSHSKNNFSSKKALIYCNKNITPKKITRKITLIDLIFSLTKYSSLKTPFYFMGENIAKDNFLSRKFIPMSDLDNNYLVLNDLVYKINKFTHHDTLFDSKPRKFDIEKNYKYFKNYYNSDFPTDFIKVISLQNNSSEIVTHKFKISSKQYFIDLNNTQANKKRYKLNKNMTISLTLKPHEINKLYFLYTKQNQHFNYKFISKINLSLYQKSIYTGFFRQFSEISDLSKYKKEKNMIYNEYDANISNYYLK